MLGSHKSSIISELPTVIFSSIQEYLSNSEYREFMNCNQHEFQSIKYETVYYIFTIINIYPRRTKMTLIINNLQEQMNKYDILLSRIKDKSKQIGIRMKDVPLQLLDNYASKFTGIHSLEIFSDTYTQYPDSFDISIFNNIHHIKFKKVSNNFYSLNNVNELTLYETHLQNVKIDSKLLQKVNISHSNVSSILSFLSCPNIQLEFVSFPKHETFHLLPGIPYRSISIKECTLLSLTIFHHCDLSHLQSLEITDLDPQDKNIQFSLFSHIDRLSFSISERKLMFKHQPIELFYGRYLHLSGFDISSWDSPANIPNVKEIHLERCKFKQNLQFLSNVKIIHLERIDTLMKLLPLPSCTCLSLSDMPSLACFFPQPKLKDLHLYRCKSISSIKCIPGQIFQKIFIASCSFYPDYSSVKNTRFLTLYITEEPLKISPFIRLSNTNDEQPILVASEKITVVIEACPKTTYDFMKLTNTKYLDISSVVFILQVVEASLSGIHDIPIVSISDKYGSFCQIYGIKNIQLLKLQNLPNLQKIDELENIDTIMISNLPNNLSFIGLGGCRVVYSHSNRVLEQQAEIYAKGDKSAVFPNYLKIFLLIEKFYLVKNITAGWPDPSLLPPNQVTRLW